MSTETRDQRRAAARAAREKAEREAAASDQRRRRLLQLGGVLLAALVVVAAVVLVAGGGGDDGQAAGTRAADGVDGQAEIVERLDGIPQDGIALGDPDAPITVVEFVDLQCPVCATFSTTELPTLIDEHVRPGTVRMELRTLTFLGEDSVRLGRMAQAAAEQDRMWPFAELVFANHGAENSGYATDDYLRRIAGAVDGLDVDQAMAARDDPAVQQRLADADRLASIEGVQGTPSFLVGPTGGRLRLVDAAALPGEIERLAEQA